MKISVWCPYYPPHPGGLESYAVELHRELAVRGHHLTVFTTDLPANSPLSSTPPNQTIIRFPAYDLIYNFPFPKFWLWRWWLLSWQFWHLETDIILSYTRFFF